MRVFVFIIGVFSVSIAIAADPSPADPLPANIEDMILSSGYLSAQEMLEQYVVSNPKSYFAYSALGKAAAMDKKFNESLRYFEQASVIRKEEGIKDVEIYNSIGWVKFLDGDTDGAVENINMAIQEKSEMAPEVLGAAYNNLGLIYMYKGRNDKARESFTQAVKEVESVEARKSLEVLDKLDKAQQQNSSNSAIELK